MKEGSRESFSAISSGRYFSSMLAGRRARDADTRQASSGGPATPDPARAPEARNAGQAPRPGRGGAKPGGRPGGGGTGRVSAARLRSPGVTADCPGLAAAVPGRGPCSFAAGRAGAGAGRRAQADPRAGPAASSASLRQSRASPASRRRRPAQPRPARRAPPRALRTAAPSARPAAPPPRPPRLRLRAAPAPPLAAPAAPRPAPAARPAPPRPARRLGGPPPAAPPSSGKGVPAPPARGALGSSSGGAGESCCRVTALADAEAGKLRPGEVGRLAQGHRASVPGRGDRDLAGRAVRAGSPGSPWRALGSGNRASRPLFIRLSGLP